MNKTITKKYLIFLFFIDIFLLIYSLYNIILKEELSVGYITIFFVSIIFMVGLTNKKFVSIASIITGILMLIVTLILTPVDFYYGLLVSISLIIVGILETLNYIP